MNQYGLRKRVVRQWIRSGLKPAEAWAKFHERVKALRESEGSQAGHRKRRANG